MDNYKAKAKIDLWVGAILWGSVGIYLVVLFFIPSEELLVWVIFVLPVLILMLWILLSSFYELKEDHIYMRIGPFFSRVKYENIKSIELKTNILSSMALSTKRIEIRQHNKSYIRGTTYIAPVNREDFIEEMRIRCFNLEK